MSFFDRSRRSKGISLEHNSRGNSGILLFDRSMVRRCRNEFRLTTFGGFMKLVIWLFEALRVSNLLKRDNSAGKYSEIRNYL